METVRVVCAHDCPDMCSLLANVEDGRVMRIEGDPDQPYTAGFACAKVNRDAELVHSPERLATPLRRIGPKGEGRFAPITWDAALGMLGFARALSPPHTAFDGDTLFALSVGEVPADVTRVGLAAADAVARAIVRGVRAATSLPGLPATRDLGGGPC